MAFGWDDVAVAGIGAAGDLFGSLFGSDGPEGLSPEAQYELQRLGIDMQTFMAVANVMNQQYQQQMESYGAGAYSDIYGGAESAAGDYAKSAFEGKLTPGAENMISQYGTGLGEQQNLSEDDIIAQAVQSGRSVDSPDVQAQLANAKTGVRSAFAQGKGQIMAQDYQNSVRNAMGAMASARTGRIGGGEPPATPMDAENAKYQEAMASWDAGRQKIIDTYDPNKRYGLLGRTRSLEDQLAAYDATKPQQSAFGGSYGQVPRGTGPEGSTTYGQQMKNQSWGAEPSRSIMVTGQGGTMYPQANPEWVKWKKRKEGAQRQYLQSGGYA
jgi:hypothetical protein